MGRGGRSTNGKSAAASERPMLRVELSQAQVSAREHELASLERERDDLLAAAGRMLHDAKSRAKAINARRAVLHREVRDRAVMVEAQLPIEVMAATPAAPLDEATAPSARTAAELALVYASLLERVEWAGGPDDLLNLRNEAVCECKAGVLSEEQTATLVGFIDAAMGDAAPKPAPVEAPVLTSASKRVRVSTSRVEPSPEAVTAALVARLRAAPSVEQLRALWDKEAEPAIDAHAPRLADWQFREIEAAYDTRAAELGAAPISDGLLDAWRIEHRASAGDAWAVTLASADAERVLAAWRAQEFGATAGYARLVDNTGEAYGERTVWTHDGGRTVQSCRAGLTHEETTEGLLRTRVARAESVDDLAEAAETVASTLATGLLVTSEAQGLEQCIKARRSELAPAAPAPPVASLEPADVDDTDEIIRTVAHGLHVVLYRAHGEKTWRVGYDGPKAIEADRKQRACAKQLLTTGGVIRRYARQARVGSDERVQAVAMPGRRGPRKPKPATAAGVSA